METLRNKIFYRTTWTSGLEVALGLGLIWGALLAIGLHNGTPITNPNVPIVIAGWLILSTNLLFGFYGEFDTEKRIFYRVNYFVFNNHLALDEIKEIRYQPMFWISSYDRSLFVVGIHNGRQVNLYYFSNRNFSEKTLATIVRDLKQAGPEIRLDAPAEALFKRYFRLVP